MGGFGGGVCISRTHTRVCVCARERVRVRVTDSRLLHRAAMDASRAGCPVLVSVGAGRGWR